MENGVIVGTDSILELNVFDSHKGTEEKERGLKLDYRDALMRAYMRKVK